LHQDYSSAILYLLFSVAAKRKKNIFQAKGRRGDNAKESCAKKKGNPTELWM